MAKGFDDWKTCDLYDFVGSWECTMTEEEKMRYRIENLCPESQREEAMREFEGGVSEGCGGARRGQGGVDKLVKLGNTRKKRKPVNSSK